MSKLGLQARRRGPNVSIPSGDLYPDGVALVAANPDVQATARPEGWLFGKSVGYETIRPGRQRFQDPHGPGIHFTPHRFAEDVGEYTDRDGYPLMVDKDKAIHHADIADLPGSEHLDDAGKLTGDAGEENRGPYMAEGVSSRRGNPADIRESEKTLPDMGDRSPGRPITRAFYGILRNPIGAFKEEYQENPVASILVAGAFVGAAYALGTEFDRAWNRRRSGRGAVGAVGAAPAAGVETAGHTVKEATEVANKAATEAGKAAEEAASAAGDVAEAAGEAVQETTEAVASAVTD